MTKAILGKDWKRPLHISQEKYDIIANAILKILTSEPMRFGELQKKLESDVKDFQGSVGWYAVGTLRQLEREGKVIRKTGNPTTYTRAGT